MPAAYIPMLETAEIVSARYGISRAAQDEFSLQSQQRTAAAQAAGLFDDEIVPLAARKLVFDKEGKPVGHEDVVATRDECNRASTTYAQLSAACVQRSSSVVSGASAQESAAGDSIRSRPGTRVNPESRPPSGRSMRSRYSPPGRIGAPTATPM